MCAIPILVVVGVFGARLLAGLARQRITYPRSGYAGLRRPHDARRRRWWATGIAAGLAGIVVYLILATPATVQWLSLVQGAAVGSFLFVLALRLYLGRYYILAVLSVLLGAALLWSPWNDSLTTGIYYSAMGGLLTASGGYVLAAYLRRRPVGDGV